MNAFIRQMAVLSVLWAFCEMLLPEGRQRRAVRLTVSLMMAASLLSSLSALLPTAAEPSRETFAFFQQGGGNEPARRLALQSAAREAEAFLVRLAGRAGYDAQGKVWLNMDGALFQAEVMLSPREGPEPSSDCRPAAAENSADAAGGGKPHHCGSVRRSGGNMKRLKENRWFLLAAVLLCRLLCFLLLSGRSAGGSGTSEEKRIAQVLSAISGAGKVEVAVYYNSGADSFSSSAPPVGSRCGGGEGADDLEVRLSLIRAVRTLLGLPEAAVDVFSMEAGDEDFFCSGTQKECRARSPARIAGGTSHRRRGPFLAKSAASHFSGAA